MARTTKYRRSRERNCCASCYSQLPENETYIRCLQCRAKHQQYLKRTSYLRNKDKYKANIHALRKEILVAYGSICACCDETIPGFLQVDHINNDGAKQRKTCRGYTFYRWLKQQGFPKDNYQLLCANCNWGKLKFGVCPHKCLGANKELD